MSSIIGNLIKVSLFGESHGELIGATINGLEAGLLIDEAFIEKQMSLRRAKDFLSTPRREKDKVEIVSGVFNNRTTGAPLTVIIRNENVNSEDYLKVFRPGNSEYPLFSKTNNNFDYRGGGHSSARLTAPLVALGAIALNILKSKGIFIYSHLNSVYNIEDKTAFSFDNLKRLEDDFIPVLDPSLKEKIVNLIQETKEEKDSLGGELQTVVFNAPIGLGSMYFASLESVISAYLFSIPSIKGVSFGQGFGFAHLKGSQANDQMVIKDGVPTFLSNNNGGILGGVSNGEPLIINTVFKPTSSIGKLQQTLDFDYQEIALELKGRHDPLTILRGRVVVESLTALALLDIIVQEKGRKWMSVS
ncbi:MAG: chorismate synthase [Bacillales bacterium]|jgi:chorismate synthase|nr:chorismate synthase [Bacillales bacterium]